MATASAPHAAAPQGPTKRLGFFDYLTILFGIVTVVSLGLAYYWHAQSVQERAPTYFVSPERTRIVDTSVPAPPQLQVLFNGKDLNANVNALTVYLWNDGKQPIKAEDVLEPLLIRLDPGCEILSARMVTVSRPVTKFSAGQVSQSTKNELPLSFKILEQGDGASIQLIYAGKADATVTIAGTVVGVRKFSELLGRKRVTVHEQPTERRFLYFTWAITCAGTVIFIARAWQRRRKRETQRFEATDLIYVAGAAMYIVMALIFTHEYRQTFQPGVPPTIWSGK